MRTVVVGNGMAAVRLVEHLVARGVDGITVLGEEPCAPYNRILLSAVLEGTHRTAAIGLREVGWCAAHGVDERLGTRVLAVHRDTRELELHDGGRVAYDRLILATGSTPLLPAIHGLADGEGQLSSRVHAFRGLVDCVRLLAAIPTAGSAVVVGGGLLGLQVARALSIRGLRTEVVEQGEHVLRSHVDETAGQVLERSLARLGTAVYTRARVTRLVDHGVMLDNGHVLDADLVVLTTGCRPNVRLGVQAGLRTARGIIVDDQLMTSDRRIFALGDCAEHNGRTTGFVAPAWEQAAVLAAHLAGEPAAYTGHRSIARLRATDLEVAVLGEPEQTPGEVVRVHNPVPGSYKKLVVAQGVIVAATLVGDLSRVGLITQAFDKATVLGPGEPGALLLADRPATSTVLPDEAEVCACAGVTAGRIRACDGLDEVRESTRATTGCGGCTSAVRSLLPATV
jgi:NAD(P)H-nitrite reductase large subunit